jgi:osmotically-inducible protein OsmY
MLSTKTMGCIEAGRNDWDSSRSSSYSPGSSYSSGSSQSYNPSQGYYGSQNRGSFGSYGQNQGQGSSYYGYDQGYGRNFGQGYGSYSSYGSQYGQAGNDYLGQQRSGSSFQSKAGRGPKGYRRSDERIKEEISDLLTSHHEVDPSEVEVKVSNCEVTLTGTVSSRHEKRLIEDLASQVTGVSDVTNQLRVQQGSDSSRSQDQSRSSQDQNKSSLSHGSTNQTSGGLGQGSQQSSKSIQ